MAKRALFIWVFFGLLLGGAVIAGQVLVDANEVEAAAVGGEDPGSDAGDPLVTTPEISAAIVVMPPRDDCGYNGNCPPPPPPPPPAPVCTAAAVPGPYEFLEPVSDGVFLVVQSWTFGHHGCGDGAVSTLVAGGFDSFAPIDDNPWFTRFAAQCAFDAGTWVGSTRNVALTLEARATNGAANGTAPVMIEAPTAAECELIANGHAN